MALVLDDKYRAQGQRVAPPSHRICRAALAYASKHYGEQAPAPGLTWTEDYIGVLISELGCGGDETFRWTYTAEYWAVVISYRFLAPKPVVYGVSVENLATHFYWEVEVDAAGQVTQQSRPQ